MLTVVRNARLVQDGLVSPCDLVAQDGVVVSIGSPGTAPGRGDVDVDAHGLYLSHGFVDIHVHGGGGHDFMDATEDAWHGAALLHLTHGTTALLPTTLASSTEELLGTFAMYRRCRGRFADGAKLAGLHIEGPYLAPGQAGAQDPAYLRRPDPAEYLRLLDACPDIRRWTIAPELEGAAQLGDELARRGILASIGHSDATYDQVCEALRHGYRHVTHLYSATSTIVRRQGFRFPGIVESAYLLAALTSEIIADGCHLPAPLLQMAYRFLGADRLALVTDAMRAAGQTGGESILGSLRNGQPVVLEDGVAKMPDRNAFAGSIATTDRLVRTMVEQGGASLPDAVKMVTETPARIVGLGREMGRLSPGRRADAVLFDETIRVACVLTDGQVRWRNAEHSL